MRTTRIHTHHALAAGAAVSLAPMASAHLIKVLRLRAGAQVILFNGDGQDYLSELVLPKTEAAELLVQSAQSACTESGLSITLLQGICRGEKMDWVLEKATELGVTRVIPVQTERSEVHLDTERAAKRREHWQRVVISACEQSGRAVVPVVEALSPLDQRLSLGFGECEKWVLEPGSAALPRSINRQAITLAVGPEGGFSERDLAQLKVAGFSQVRLGARIMRTETAGPAAIAALQTLFGDFG